MTEEAKYYPPETKEFHVEFEYEWRNKGSNDWNTAKIKDPEQLADIWNTIYDLRVKYLDRSDIESLGFNRIEECENYNNNESTYQKRVSDDEIYCLVFHYDINKVTISVHDKDIKTNMSVERKFQGTLKNKSELKQVLKMI